MIDELLDDLEDGVTCPVCGRLCGCEHLKCTSCGSCLRCGD